MIAKLIVEGKAFPIEILDLELQQLLAPPKKTGYERVNIGDGFFWDYADKVVWETDSRDSDDNSLYGVANYYSDKTVAENNARADKLMRQLRRFAVEHRTKGIMDWGPTSSYKWCIFYDYGESKLCCHQDMENRTFGAIYFESKSQAKRVIEAFKDELIWYFTEYKDSL